MADNDGKISVEDIESKVREIEGVLQGGVERAKPRLLATGVFITLLVLALAYLLGRRVGNRSSAVVEVRRV